MMGSLQYANTAQQADVEQVMGAGHERAQVGRQRRNQIDDAKKTSRIAQGHIKTHPLLFAALRRESSGYRPSLCEMKTYAIFGKCDDVLQADGSGQPFSPLNGPARE